MSRALRSLEQGKAGFALFLMSDYFFHNQALAKNKIALSLRSRQPNFCERKLLQTNLSLVYSRLPSHDTDTRYCIAERFFFIRPSQRLFVVHWHTRLRRALGKSSLLETIRGMLG